MKLKLKYANHKFLDKPGQEILVDFKIVYATLSVMVVNDQGDSKHMLIPLHELETITMLDEGEEDVLEVRKNFIKMVETTSKKIVENGGKPITVLSETEIKNSINEHGKDK